MKNPQICLLNESVLIEKLNKLMSQLEPTKCNYQNKNIVNELPIIETSIDQINDDSSDAWNDTILLLTQIS